MQRDLQRAKQEAREAHSAKEQFQEEMSDFAETVEMATLDKEMAEEKAETLQIELEQLKEKLEEKTLDLEILRTEMSDRVRDSKNNLLFLLRKSILVSNHFQFEFKDTRKLSKI